MIAWEKISEKLGEWAVYFKPFYDAGGFETIYTKLKEDGKTKKILPEGKDLFKAFELCPAKELKAIWLGQDPFPTIKYGKVVADGLAFSCSYTKEEQPSLKLIYDALEDEYFEGLNLNFIREPDLSYLAKQGLLLLNSSLTTPENSPGTHKELWKPFMEFFFKDVLLHFSGVPIVFFGKQAAEYEPLVNLKSFVTKIVEHPAAASYSKRPFQHNHLFKWIDVYLKETSKQEINWYETPF